jgi:phospholipase C
MKTVMPQIEHVVYLMLENRSFDNLLGWLYDEDNPPQHIISNPTQTDVPFYGLVENKYFNCFKGETTPHYVKKAEINKSCHSGCLMSILDKLLNRHKGCSHLYIPDPDPNEPYQEVNAQLFGSQENPPENQLPAMEGFLQNYSTVRTGLAGTLAQDKGLAGMIGKLFSKQITPEQALQIMETYTPEQLSVINTLAKDYAVSDYWFSSIPTQTNCNRAFSVCGTSLGQVDNHGPLEGLVPAKFDTRTIWNVLAENGYSSPADWMIYHQDQELGLFGYARHAFNIPDPKQHVTSIDAFFDAVAKGNLPAFSYLEPAWYRADVFNNGNSYHPPSDLGPGEHFLKQLYEKLTANRALWEKTLLIITFDEHGGTYDHIPPPWGATPPWGTEQPPPENIQLECGFKFNRFGVRVPTLLISPWVEEQTVFRSLTDVPYDHTSMIATILSWKNIPKEQWQLGERVANAPTFENVLTRSTPREDIPAVDVSEMFRIPLSPAKTAIHPLHVEMLPHVLQHLSLGQLTTEELQEETAQILKKSKNVKELNESLQAFKSKWTPKAGE